MGKPGQVIIFLVLSAFLWSSLVPLNLFEQTSESLELSVEDIQDATDAEDELEDNDEFKEKEFTTRYLELFRNNISLTIAHQAEIFSSHHPSVITPPPRA